MKKCKVYRIVKSPKAKSAFKGLFNGKYSTEKKAEGDMREVASIFGHSRKWRKLGKIVCKKR